jgi:hypothetical protein
MSEIRDKESNELYRWMKHDVSPGWRAVSSRLSLYDNILLTLRPSSWKIIGGSARTQLSP